MSELSPRVAERLSKLFGAHARLLLHGSDFFAATAVELRRERAMVPASHWADTAKRMNEAATVSGRMAAEGIRASSPSEMRLVAAKLLINATLFQAAAEKVRQMGRQANAAGGGGVGDAWITMGDDYSGIADVAHQTATALQDLSMGRSVDWLSKPTQATAQATQVLLPVTTVTEQALTRFAPVAVEELVVKNESPVPWYRKLIGLFQSP